MKRPASSSQRGTQQQISAMFGDRVGKPKTFLNPLQPAKHPKHGHSPDEVHVEPQNVKKISSTQEIQSRKRKWRLSELLQKERDAKRRKSQSNSAFVYTSPPIDSQKPASLNAVKNSSAISKPAGKLPLLKNLATSNTKDANCVHDSTHSVKSIHKSGHAGTDAYWYDRSMLPKSHTLLLDVLSGLESAISLLRTRQVRPTFSSVRDIVARSARRNFTLRALSQLAHIVPEAVAVLPGTGAVSKNGRVSDNLIVRLDNVNKSEDRAESIADVSNADERKSSLGNSATRLRRSLLHKRLLLHVRQQHDAYVKRNNNFPYTGEGWHPDFNLCMDVEELPAPPLYPVHTAKGIKKSLKARPLLNELGTTSLKPESPAPSKPSHEEDKDDACIPLNLLDKVRNREKTIEASDAVANADRENHVGLLSKLPCTMDTVCTILRSEKRSAMGWGQLLRRLEKLHPKQWDTNDLDKQLDVIATLASEWCRKVELKSSRGGFAFRIVSDSSFSKARASVIATKSYQP